MALIAFQFLIFGIYFCITCMHHNTRYCVMQPNTASHKQMCIFQKTRKCSFHALVAKWFLNKNGPFLLWIVPQSRVPSIQSLRWVYSAIMVICAFNFVLHSSSCLSSYPYKNSQAVKNGVWPLKARVKNDAKSNMAASDTVLVRIQEIAVCAAHNFVLINTILRHLMQQKPPLQNHLASTRKYFHWGG